MPEPILDGDFVSRIILDPKDYTHGGILDLGAGFNFPSDGNNTESVNCNRLLDNDPVKIHALGYKKEASDQSKGRNYTYKGYVQGKAEDITAINIQTYHFTLTHAPAPDNDAHCDLKMCYTAKNKAVRGVAISKLIAAFSDIVKP